MIIDNINYPEIEERRMMRIMMMNEKKILLSFKISV